MDALGTNRECEAIVQLKGRQTLREYDVLNLNPDHRVVRRDS